VSQTTIYHNPGCSKSRETLALLTAHGIAPTVVLYLEAPPDEARLRAIISGLDADATALLRTGDAAFVDSGLDAATMDDDAVIGFLLDHPSVLQRPVVVHGDRAAIGRPPERVLELFGERT